MFLVCEFVPLLIFILYLTEVSCEEQGYKEVLGWYLCQWEGNSHRRMTGRLTVELGRDSSLLSVSGWNWKLKMKILRSLVQCDLAFVLELCCFVLSLQVQDSLLWRHFFLFESLGTLLRWLGWNYESFQIYDIYIIKCVLTHSAIYGRLIYDISPTLVILVFTYFLIDKFLFHHCSIYLSRIYSVTSLLMIFLGWFFKW